MSGKKSKPFGFGFSTQGSGVKPRTLLESEDQLPSKPLALDYFSDEDSKPKKRKLITLDNDFENETTNQNSSKSLQDVNDFVGDLEDDRPLPRTSTGSGIRGFVPQGYKTATESSDTFKEQEETSKEQADDDPLDAFMLDIDNQVQKQSQDKSQQEKIRRDDIEEEDFVESYVNHMKKKGIDVGKSQRPIEKDEACTFINNINSDEEVYATARAIDAQLEYDSDDNPIIEQKRKDIEPLPPIIPKLNIPKLKNFSMKSIQILPICPMNVQDFATVLTSCLNSAFGLLSQDLYPHFFATDGNEGTERTVERNVMLIKLLPDIARATNIIVHDTPNRFLEMIVGFVFDVTKVTSGKASSNDQATEEKPRSAINEYWNNRRRAYQEVVDNLYVKYMASLVDVQQQQQEYWQWQQPQYIYPQQRYYNSMNVKGNNYVDEGSINGDEAVLASSNVNYISE
ncbi:3384_t:CDS:2 [Acaulospora colombiana]|uniref:3384_t:CDS:1 n=1 Tax=Acaulospora colombiana TaxID=27376 RepID=A0ACA9MS41_9GLOM|nr:3384_t:CDS:2 [Acaulospora colombiana]